MNVMNTQFHKLWNSDLSKKSQSCSCTAGIQERKLSIEVQPPQAAKTEKKNHKKKSHTVVSISLGNIAPRHGVGSLRTLVDGEKRKRKKIRKRKSFEPSLSLLRCTSYCAL